MMPPPGLQIQLWPPVTLIFNLDPDPEVDRFMPLPPGPLVPISSKSRSFRQYRVQNISNRRIWMDGLVENVKSSLAGA